MTKKEYRRRKVANDYRRSADKKITVSAAYKQTEVIEKVCKALGPLSPKQRSKVFRALLIMLEDV